MRMTFKSIFALTLAGIFLAGSVLCCCIRHLAKAENAAKASCCHKKAKADTDKDSCGSCSSMVKSAENVKVFDLAVSNIHSTPVFIQNFSFKPVHSIKPVFLNGPPGPVSAVPLFILQRTLRI